MTKQANPLEPRFAAAELANARRAEFENLLERDRRTEWRLFWCELIALVYLAEFAIWVLGLGYQGR